MQTQCPQCGTRFRITDAQLHMADGYVRCGVCKQVFNAVDPDLSPDADLQPLSPAPSATDAGAERDNHEQHSDENEQESYDLFNEEHNRTLTYVVPDHIREADNGSSWPATALWSLGIVFLTATLFLEYIWFNREQISRLPEIQASLVEICLQYDCSRLNLRDSSRIRLLQRNVYSDPEHKNALMVDLTIRNTSEFSQPYPLMQVKFSDVRGRPVAARRFAPEEYLGSKPEQPIRPGDNVSISMEILDPGKQAVTYEFDFL